MPRYVETEIGNRASHALTFEMPARSEAAPVVTQLADGALVMECVPFIANQDMVYLGYELPLMELFGMSEEESFEQWETVFVGRLTQECAEMMLDQFEGLPLTDGHVMVEIGKRDETAVGAFLRNAILDTDLVRTRALIYQAAAILKVEVEGSELSIGGDGALEANLRRGTSNEPDFFIHRINLNHVALVGKGRAGPQARLLNHRATLAHTKKEIPHMKVTINGVEIEVPDVAVNHFNSRIDDLTSTNTHLENAQQVLQTSLIEVTTERDTMAGALAVAQATLETTQATVVEMKNNAPDVSVEAARIANEHAAFVLEAQRLNHADELVLGAYERDAVMLTVLNARGAQFADTTNTDTLKGAWTFALANADTTTRSVLDPAPGKTVAPLANVSAGATAAVNASYFGGKKKETK